jgi:hypothetical protein
MSSQLIIVERDVAKQLFGIRDPAEFSTFLGELATGADVHVLILPDGFELANDLLQQATGERASLQWAIRGGREMPVGEGKVELKRPDIVAQIAIGLKEHGSEVIGSEAFAGEAWANDFCRELTEFYADAASRGGAVLIVDGN